VIRQRLPFPLQGIDSDNGSEFINRHLMKYCQQHELTFTRSRSNRKNDNCFVEQKNYTVVRRAVGYRRYETAEQQRILNALYDPLRLYLNYFQPVMKLVEKIRDGSKVTKKYEVAQTPYERLLASDKVSKQDKAKLRAEYDRLNPAQLKRDLEGWQSELLKSVTPALRKAKGRAVNRWSRSLGRPNRSAAPRNQTLIPRPNCGQHQGANRKKSEYKPILL